MRRLYLVLAAVCVSWGTIPLVVRAVDLPGPAIAFARVGIAAAGLGVALAVGAWRGDVAHAVDGAAAPALFSYRPLRCVLIGVLLAVHWAALLGAYRIAPAGTVILVVYLAPVGVAVLAPRALGERNSRRTLLALGLAVGGFLLLARPAVRAAGGDGLALAGIAAATFVALVLLSKPLSRVYGGLRLTFMEMAVAVVALLPVAAMTTWGSPRWVWAWLLVLGLGHTAVATSVYLSVLGRVPAAHVGIFGYLEPVSVVGFAWVALGEAPAAATLAGGALIVGAGILLVRSAGSAEVPVDARPTTVPR